MNVKPYELVHVTPGMALKWLENNESNRKPKDAKFTQYARDMQNGNWFFAGGTIVFAAPDSFGVERLIDGQNRLMAIVKSGTTQPFIIVRGLATDVQSVIDSGAVRTVADQLSMGGHAMSGPLAATGRLIFRIGRGADTFANSREAATNQELIKLLNDNPAIEASVMAVEGINRRGLRIPAAAVGHYFGLVRESAMTMEFFEKLRSGVNMQTREPVLALHNRLSNDKKLTTVQQLYLVLRMLNMTRAGQTIERIVMPSVRISGQHILSGVQQLTAEKVNRIDLESGE